MTETVFSLAVAFLKLASVFVGWLQERQAMQAGQDAEIARASVAILLQTQAAKQIMQEITAMSEADVDKLLKDLEK